MSTVTEELTVEDLDFAAAIFCETDDAAHLHGEGEDATGWVHVPCPHCGLDDTGYVGDACTLWLHQIIEDGDDYSCDRCEGVFPTSLIWIQPI